MREDGRAIEMPERRSKLSKWVVATIELLGKRTVRQDAASEVQLECEGMPSILVIVADGHGDEDGAACAQEAVSHMIDAIRALQTVPDVAWFKEHFAQIHGAFIMARYTGGTTLTCVFVRDNSLTAAYVGDAEARLAHEDGHLQTLTRPHGYSTHTHERARLEELGAQMQSGKIMHGQQYMGPSRSLGDTDFDPYVSHEPEMVHAKLQGTEHFLLVGSDGFWNLISKSGSKRHAVERILEDASSVEEAQSAIIALLARWKLSDEVTLKIVDLRQQQNP